MTITQIANRPITDFVTGEVFDRLSSEEFRFLLEDQRATRAVVKVMDEDAETGKPVDSVAYHDAYDASRVAYQALSHYKNDTAQALPSTAVSERDFTLPETLFRVGEAEPGTFEWLRMRQSTLGGSDVGAICQVGGYGRSARDSVRKMKTAQKIEEQVHSGAALRGDLWEPLLLNILSDILGEEVFTNKATYSDGQRSVNLDGFMLDPASYLVTDIGEAKTSTFPEDWTENSIPERYVLQVQHYMDMFGLVVGHLIVNVDDERILVYRIAAEHKVPAGETTPKGLGAEFSYTDVIGYALKTLATWNAEREAGPKPVVRRKRKPNGLAESWGRAFECGYVSVDLETTTFRPETGHIIELAMIRDDGEVFHRFYGLPEAHLAWNGTGAEDIHQIAPEDLEGLPVLLGNGSLLSEIQAFIGDRVLVAHNASFERAWLSGFGLDADYADTMTAFAALVDDAGIPDNTMRSLVEWAGGTYADAHRAMADTQMLHDTLPALRAVVKDHIQTQDA